MLSLHCIIYTILKSLPGRTKPSTRPHAARGLGIAVLDIFKRGMCKEEYNQVIKQFAKLHNISRM